MRRVFNRLSEHDIPFYYMTGNHATRASQQFLREQTAHREFVTNLTATGVEIGRSVRLCGVNRRRGGSFDADAHKFPSGQTAGHRVLVLHQTVRQLQPPHLQRPESGWKVDLDDLEVGSAGGSDLVVSGHHHGARRQSVGDAEAL